MTIDTSLPFHFKDYRHAHALVQNSNFDAAPKVKFLYHIVFELSTEANGLISSENLNLLSVLANTVTLPSYNASVETLNQYNRKKNFQTKIEYKDVNVSFYDDNAGVSRSLLESYYKYYFAEASARSFEDINPRNNLTGANIASNRFGLDNTKTEPFFKYIQIFQLSKQKWFCYTLVNPIISQWSHDELAYAEGSAIVENKISIKYESVLYTKGDISENGDPAGFADVWYDLEKAPAGTYTQPSRTVLKPTAPTTQTTSIFRTNDESTRAPVPVGYNVPDPFTFPPEITVPQATPRPETVSASVSSSRGRYDTAQIQNILSSNQVFLNQVTNLALGSGTYSSEWGPSNFSNYASLSSSEKATIQQDILSKLNTNNKLRIIAEDVISSTKLI